MDFAQVVAVGLVLVTHALALRRPWRALGRRQLPRVVDFATLGVVLYYDLGLVLELAGEHPGEPFYPSLLTQPDAIWGSGLAIIGLAPWLLRAGARLLRGGYRPPIPHGPRRPLPGSFWLVALTASGTLAAIGLWIVWTAGGLHSLQAQTFETWGRAVILLHLPLFLLAFALGRGEGVRGWRAAGCAVLVGCALAATLPTGHRMHALFPVLTWVLFRRPPTVRRLGAAAVGAVVAVTLVLPLYKGQLSGADYERLIANTYIDLTRGPVLGTALEAAPWWGTNVLAYPGEGYVFGALFYVPRALVPIKPETPTGWGATAYVRWMPKHDLASQLVFGLVEDFLFNFGRLALLPGLVAWGLVLGAGDRLARRRPEWTIPTRLGALVLVGYGLSLTIAIFVTMGLVGWACGWLWPARREIAPHGHRVAYPLGRPVVRPRPPHLSGHP